MCHDVELLFFINNTHLRYQLEAIHSLVVLTPVDIFLSVAWADERMREGERLSFFHMKTKTTTQGHCSKTYR